MRFNTTRAWLALVAGAALLSCSDTPSAPIIAAPAASLVVNAPDVVISQIYGGGGNAGATYTHDFVELFNPGSQPVTMTGWSVQYASSTGSSWNVTQLSGTVEPGRYYLVQMAAGAGGTVPLPAPDATGSATMAAGAGKVLLARQTTAYGGTTCPADGNVVDFVQYGSTSTTGSCLNQTGTSLSNTVAAIRLAGGCAYTGSNSADFTTGDPAPRNSATAANTCGGTDPEPPAPVARIVVTPATASIAAGGTQQFTAAAFDADDNPLSVTFSWSGEPAEVATVSASGLATGVAAGSATITATSGDVTGTATLTVSVMELPPVRFSELHYDNFGTDTGEAIEIEGPVGTDLDGWSVVLYNGNGGVVYNTRALAGVIPNTCDGRGVVVLTYPQDGIQNGSPDGMALISPSGVVEFLSYEGVFTATDGPAAGMQSVDIGASQSSAPVGTSLWRNANNVWQSHTANFGACGDDAAPPPAASISFSGRLPGDPALPVGFEDQLFATLRDGTGTVVTTTFVWAAETPTIATIDQNGVLRALAAGTATVRATAADGTTATYSLPTRVGAASSTAQYAGNAEFGEPADGDASDDYIIRHPQFTASWNHVRGTPNWVSYNLEATHFGPEDRCDCFTFDDALPAGFPRYTTADYTGAGAFHGFGIDRGHLARSFDRTSASLDNARTFLFTNIIPQAADNNQGPWAAMETYLGNLARFNDKEVYIIAGPAGSAGTIKDEGKITLPTHTWKVAVIMPRDHGLAHIDDRGDLDVIAVIMPNVAGIRNVNWQDFVTTVDAVEALSGYDLLALLADHIEIAVESGTHPPVAAADGPYTSMPGETVLMSAAGSTDADGHALTYHWSFGNGGTATGVTTSTTYAEAGTFTVRLIVTDVLGLADTTFTTATVATQSQTMQDAIALINALLVDEKLSAAEVHSLVVKLSAALRQFERGHAAGALGGLRSTVEELSALIRSGRLSEADGVPLRDLVQRVVASITS